MQRRKTDPRDKIVSFNPATLEKAGEVDATPPGRASEIVREAREAQRAWRGLGVRRRAGILLEARRLLLDRAESIGRTITEEMGRPFTESMVMEVEAGLDVLGHSARRGLKILTDRPLRLHNPFFLRRESRVLCEPLGVVAVIAPWNWPLLIPLGCIAPALAAGNAVVFKPSELTPLVGERIHDLFRDAGVPEGVFQTIQGGGAVGEALVGSGADKVFFTGSTAVGSRIMEQAGRTLTPVVLELGGSDPAIVCDDADLDTATSGILWGGMNNCGQNCNSIERVYVHEAVADRFLELLTGKMRRLRVGNGLDPDTDVGPLASEAQAAKMETVIRKAKSQGGSVIAGGRRIRGPGGHFFEPTLIAWERTRPPFQDEIFGPVMTVTVFERDDEAVRLANHSPFGLAASIWTRDRSRARALAPQIEAGTVMVNDAVVSFGIPEASWTGLKRSGFGWVHGDKGFDEMVNLKYYHRDPLDRGQKFWWFPYGSGMVKDMTAGLRFLFGRGVWSRLRAAPAVAAAFGGYLLWNRKRRGKW
jgi:acyl-CoA reductase-like NAD-dependent aldehyde dehydrogenase